ncbi:octopamine receptor 2-like [Saccostrea cucullata]|uniref:octopamine receptor 2-like n=1 Tax=Saccostrea cuccullata TaxID=36930 RepID=UPI002ED5EC81
MSSTRKTNEMETLSVNTVVTDLMTINMNKTEKDSLFPCGSNTTQWTLTDPVCSLNFHSFVSFVFVAALLSIITFFTIFGNGLVWVALYRFPKLRSMSNCLIGNLAMSDMLLALTVLPISIGNDLLGYWVFGEIMCPIWLCIDVLYCTASIWGLVTIAVDRYTATVYPVWYFERRSPLRALIYIIMVWFFSIIVSIAPFIGWRDMIPNLYKFNIDTKRYECVLFETEGYVVYSAMGSFVIPAILMLFLYFRIFVILRKRMKTMQLKKEKFKINLNMIDQDYDSCPLQEENSQIDLSGTPITQVKMSDKATQISPVTKKQYTSLPIGNSSMSKPNVLHEDSGRKTNEKGDYSDCILPDVICKSQTEEGTEDEKQPCLLDVNVNKTIQGITCDCTQKTGETQEKEQLKNTNSDVSKRPSKKRISITFKKRNSKSKHIQGIKTKYELREQRATKRMAIVMGCFLFCWFPFLFMYLIRSFCVTCYINVHIQASIIWLGYVNSSINPVLYTLFNDDFRQAFKIILGLEKEHPQRNRL